MEGENDYGEFISRILRLLTHPRSLNLIKQLITNNNLIRSILDKVHNYILFNYVYPVLDRGSVLFDYRSREHSRINEEAVLFVFETLKP